MTTRTVVLLILLVPTAHANAAWHGRLDLNLNADAIGVRELHDGNWLAGVSKQVWHLDENGKERLHLSVYQAWRTDRGDPAYGLSVGLNTGKAGEWLQDMVDKVAPELSEKARFLTKLSNWASLEAYGGYRLRHGDDTHAWMYGIGGKVRIPLDLKRGL